MGLAEFRLLPVREGGKNWGVGYGQGRERVLVLIWED
jgi:hypothetical protein